MAAEQEVSEQGRRIWRQVMEARQSVRQSVATLNDADLALLAVEARGLWGLVLDVQHGRERRAAEE